MRLCLLAGEGASELSIWQDRRLHVYSFLVYSSSQIHLPLDPDVVYRCMQAYRISTATGGFLFPWTQVLCIDARGSRAAAILLVGCGLQALLAKRGSHAHSHARVRSASCRSERPGHRSGALGFQLQQQQEAPVEPRSSLYLFAKLRQASS